MNVRIKFGLFCLCLVGLQIIFAAILFIGVFHLKIIDKRNIPLCMSTIIMLGGISIIVGAVIAKKRKARKKMQNKYDQEVKK